MTVRVAKILWWSGGKLKHIEEKNRAQKSWAHIKGEDAMKTHRNFLLLQKQDTHSRKWFPYSFVEYSLETSEWITLAVGGKSNSR